MRCLINPPYYIVMGRPAGLAWRAMSLIISTNYDIPGDLYTTTLYITSALLDVSIQHDTKYIISITFLLQIARSIFPFQMIDAFSCRYYWFFPGLIEESIYSATNFIISAVQYVSILYITQVQMIESFVKSCLV